MDGREWGKCLKGRGTKKTTQELPNVMPTWGEPLYKHKATHIWMFLNTRTHLLFVRRQLNREGGNGSDLWSIPDGCISYHMYHQNRRRGAKQAQVHFLFCLNLPELAHVDQNWLWEVNSSHFVPRRNHSSGSTRLHDTWPSPCVSECPWRRHQLQRCPSLVSTATTSQDEEGDN